MNNTRIILSCRKIPLLLIAVILMLTTACAAALPAQPTLSSPSGTKAALAEKNPPLTEDELSMGGASNSERNQENIPHYFTISNWASNRPMDWEGGWCAVSQAILEQNLKYLKPAFWLDGKPVPLSYFYAYGDGQGCYYWATIASNWPKGVTTLKGGFTITSPINDGENSYTAGQLIYVTTVTVP